MYQGKKANVCINNLFKRKLETHLQQLVEIVEVQNKDLGATSQLCSVFQAVYDY